MLKKLIAMILALALTPMLALGENSESAGAYLEGLIEQVTGEGVLINSVGGSYEGQVMVNTDGNTVFEGVENLDGLRPGQYIFVAFDGKMTRSLPPQVYGTKISCHILEGEVTELLEGGFMLEQKDGLGPVIVHTEEAVAVGDQVTVYTNGIMALSYPGQVTAVYMEKASNNNQWLPMELQANLTTGYDWIQTWTEEGIAALEGEYVPDEAEDGMVGVGGKYAYRLTGLAPGETALTLTYQRPGDAQSAVISLTYGVRVDEELNVTVTEIKAAQSSN